MVVGGGVVGLSAAWRAAREGAAVTVIDPDPGGGASYAAAGMLAPVSEVTYTEESLLRLGVDSLARWPGFAAELTEDSGDDLDLRSAGTLDVAFGADDLAALGELAEFMAKLDLPVERLTGRECRRLEPLLAPSVRGGILAPGDSWVNPRRVTRALLTALSRLGVPVVRRRVAEVVVAGGTVQGVRLGGPGGPASGGVRPGRAPLLLQDSGEAPETIPAEQVVLAAGAWTGSLPGVPDGVLPPVRPVKGQIMRLRTPYPALTRCVRGTVHGSPVYLVPRGDGEVVLGATQEEMGFDTRVTAGGLWEILRDARELVPGVTEWEVTDVVAGLRPGTPDNLPAIGPTALPGLLVASGHHRGGVLLAPLTADLVVRLLAGETIVDHPCSPSRFEESSR
ncbi:FAD-dependent oxidoreductase [Spongiactinospora rosea]|uniref:FAD-dependent oxidoreductase n=1 Tax=Spongiactinospora rosea TaxID=2248750 RepID=UPI001CECA4EC|nr:FAD-dependent oxidoreductase [Spongiactinospora rosea]